MKSEPSLIADEPRPRLFDLPLSIAIWPSRERRCWLPLLKSCVQERVTVQVGQCMGLCW